MRPASRKRGRQQHTGLDTSDPGWIRLLALPTDVLQLVLDALTEDDQYAFLSTSKAVAQQLMQHRSGELTLEVQARAGKNWAATRHLLQWAPPACLKLKIKGPSQKTKIHSLLVARSAEALYGLLGTCTATGQSAAQQQFMCLTEVCLKGFTLTEVVPPGLARACPNVHTLHLHDCKIAMRSSSSSCGEAAASSIAPTITHLQLTNTELPQLAVSLAGSSRITRLQQQASQQLSASLPNLTCYQEELTGFRKERMFRSFDFIGSQWGQQLTELHLPGLSWEWRLDGGDLSAAISQLQQLHTVVLPDYEVCHSKEMRALLALQQLTHVELLGFAWAGEHPEDFSNHPCTWKYLQLHLAIEDFWPLHLAMVPLHSLTHPLVLGGDCLSKITVSFPGPTWAAPDDVAKAQRLSKRLGRCGVLLLAHTISYDTHAGPLDLNHDAHDAYSAAVLSAMGSAFSAAERLRFRCATIGQQVLGALRSIHQHTVKHLKVVGCIAEFQSQMFWHTLLSSLPILEELYVGYPYSMVAGEDAVALAPKLCRSLVAAMAQQAAGRCMSVEVKMPTPDSSVVETVLSSVQPLPVGVHIEATHDGDWCLTLICRLP